MLVEALLSLMIGPLASCDTGRAALGNCSSQLSTSLGAGQSFQLNLARETSVPGTQTVQPGSSTVISAPVASAPAPAAAVSAPKPAATPKPATTPKPAATPKPATTPKPAASSVSRPAASAPTGTGCPVLDPPQARLYMPPCPSSSPTPKPVAKPTVAKPAAPATTVALPVQAAPPLAQTVSSPAVSTRTPSRSVTERDEFAAQVPTPRLTISPTSVRVGAQVEFQLSASATTNAGSLLGQAAEIRFTPIAALIATGDSATLQGFSATHRYREVGVYSAGATVSYRVDYRIGSGNWVLNAAILDSSSNSVSVQVLEPRKRTLLVD
jgi:hypothetical protein